MAEKFIQAVRAALHPELAQSDPPPSRRRSVVDIDHPQHATAPPPRQPPSPITPSSPPSPPSPTRRPSPPPLPQQQQQNSHPSKKRSAQPSSACSDPSSAPSKRARSEKASRGARYRTHPSKAVLDRLHRSNHHRLFLVARDGGSRADAPVFAVMGATLNVYHVTVSEAPECDCPDFLGRRGTSNHGPCKHLIFVFLRVLKVHQDNHVWWQVRLLPGELSEVLGNAPNIARLDCMADNAAREHYLRNAPARPASSGSSSGQQPAQPVEGDCPVCFEDMANNADGTNPDNEVTSCHSCSQYFHKTCLKRWATAQTTSQAGPTCPLCRAQLPPERSGAAARNPGDLPQYMNLSQHTSSQVRPMTLAELYADTHQYIGRGSSRGGGGGRGRAGRSRGAGV